MRKVVLDTETTGLDYNSGHRLVEIGCIELLDNMPTGNFWHSYINPGRNVPSAAQEVHGLSDIFLQDKPKFEEIFSDFIEFIDISELIIHNADFDLSFINSELRTLNVPVIEKNRVIDTLELAKEKFPGAAVNLDSLCRRYNISLENREKHGALIDAKLLAEVYLELTGGRQPVLDLDLKNKTKKDDLVTTEDTTSKRKDRTYLKYKLTEQELLMHTKLLSKITNPIWKR